eukprot:CAMPEP_0197825844 /NCGR_PEP_ID=MMETSP1437-20131217/2878_1 /TAXON_ID=49252 ORGANISM="Eucampia antarctica, Strain CCMP1452" /NCGR_SAMPLE_ID=MMETSP1437 /ASSEMBLY_ACC=CAM_ASM_001096 /LENGTH=67 /DNA_ID=CAMNT_0043426013 /DNA_START=32 /DNA_END=232 /DNA_ORIENTATION=-
MSLLKKEVDELTPNFLGYAQQDAHEFLTSLLQLLQDRLFPEYNTATTNNNNNNNNTNDNIYNQNDEN